MDSSPNFSRLPRRSRRRKKSGGGEVEFRVPSEWGTGGKPGPRNLAEEGWIFGREGPRPHPAPYQLQGSPWVQYVQGPRARASRAHTARSPKRGARPPGTIPTHRALAAGPTDGLGRKAK